MLRHVILSNGDNNAMLLNCCVARRLLQSDVAFDPPLSALDWAKVPALKGAGDGDSDSGEGGFSLEGLKQEEIVNMGIQALVLNAFVAE